MERQGIKEEQQVPVVELDSDDDAEIVILSSDDDDDGDVVVIATKTPPKPEVEPHEFKTPSNVSAKLDRSPLAELAMFEPQNWVATPSPTPAQRPWECWQKPPYQQQQQQPYFQQQHQHEQKPECRVDQQQQQMPYLFQPCRFQQHKQKLQQQMPYQQQQRQPYFQPQDQHEQKLECLVNQQEKKPEWVFNQHPSFRPEQQHEQKPQQQMPYQQQPYVQPQHQDEQKPQLPQQQRLSFQPQHQHEQKPQQQRPYQQQQELPYQQHEQHEQKPQRLHQQQLTFQHQHQSEEKPKPRVNQQPHQMPQPQHMQYQQHQTQPQPPYQQPQHMQYQQHQPQHRVNQRQQEMPQQQPPLLPRNSRLFKMLGEIIVGDAGEVEPPDGLMTVKLLKHQRIALAWMQKSETREKGLHGGILADDQGLGKTVSTIALLLTAGSRRQECKLEAVQQQEQTNKQRPGGTLIVCPPSVLRQWEGELANKAPGKLSVLFYHGQGRKRLKVRDVAKYDVVLTTYAAVSLEVPMVVADGPVDKFAGFKKKNTKEKEFRPGALAAVNWFRVVLDEVHIIKNSRTMSARACCGLSADRRWCLTGTPLQNSVNDVFSYFRFLRFEPFDAYAAFEESIYRPIQRNPDRGYMKLQAILQAVLMRRTKQTLIEGRPIIDLPPRTVKQRKVEFTAEERSFYEVIDRQSKSTLRKLEAEGKLKECYLQLLEMLLRMRQACNHPQLVTYRAQQRLDLFQNAQKLEAAVRADLLKELEEKDVMACPICHEVPEEEERLIAGCGHIYCRLCILEELTVFGHSKAVADFEDEEEHELEERQNRGSRCSAEGCRSTISFKKLYIAAALRTPGDNATVEIDELEDEEQDEDDAGKSRKKVGSSSSKKKRKKSDFNSPGGLQKGKHAWKATSSKVKAVMEELQSPEAAAEKALVFSVWTSMLDLLEQQLAECNIRFTRLDGRMDLQQRELAISTFSNDPDTRVMLMSLRAASLGLNLVAASRILLMDPWWNPTVEDQAIDRAHRIGQQREVKVTKFTVKDSVEDRVLALQEQKQQMVSSTFGDTRGKRRSGRLALDELLFLFNY